MDFKVFRLLFCTERRLFRLLALNACMEATFVPVRFVLVFFASFRVLIKDFFWMGIAELLSLKFLSSPQTEYLCATGVPIVATVSKGSGRLKNQSLTGFVSHRKSCRKLKFHLVG